MTTWLPRRRTSSKPCAAGIRHTSRPERTRNLLNGDVEVGDVDLAVKALRDRRWTCGLEEETEGLLEVGAGLLDGVACQLSGLAFRGGGPICGSAASRGRF